MTAEPMPDPAITYLFATRQDRSRPPAPVTPPASSTAAPAAADDDLLVITDPVKFVDGVYKRALNDLQLLPHGQRNDGLNTVAFSLGRLIASNLLDLHTTEQFLEDACDIWPDRDPRNVTGTIRSGLRAGMNQPRRWVQGERTTADKPAPFIPVDPETGVVLELPVRDQAADALAAELVTQRARREAKRLLDAEDAAASFREPPSRLSLVDELAIPDEPVTYAIGDVLPTGANALLTAAFKTGKTTVIGDLARAFADGGRFLGKFDVPEQTGRLVIFNYELSEGQYRRWLRDLGIVNEDRVAVLHLRGFRLPVIVPAVEEWVVRWLIEHEARMWVVDPFARAFTGCGNENDNGEVGRFLDTLDVIKERAGVTELVLPTHTGRMQQEIGQERARGATRLDDWADVRWMLNKIDDGDGEEVPPRFFSATGRDVEVPEERLHYDETTRALRMGGPSRQMFKSSVTETKVYDAIAANPGIGTVALRKLVGGTGKACDNAAARLESAHRIRVDRDRTPHAHYVGGIAGLVANPTTGVIQ